MKTNYIKEIYSIFKNSSGISTDTRSIKENSIFFALKGPNFNGNNFFMSFTSLPFLMMISYLNAILLKLVKNYKMIQYFIKIQEKQGQVGQRCDLFE